MTVANARITAWVTKYALTLGIQRVDAVVCRDISADMISYGRHATAHGKDWHRTPEAARARAEAMRKAKIASLRKQVAKLEAMTFNVDPNP